MESLVATLLSYARLDQAMQSLEKKPVDLTALLDHACVGFCHDRDIIDWQNPGQRFLVGGDKRHLTMLINNLLQNACNHARNRISVRLVTPERVRCCLSVEDDGPGITEELRPEVVKPFVRDESSTGQKGYGMGLAIVSRIADWHQCTFSIGRSAELGGASMKIDFERLTQSDDRRL